MPRTARSAVAGYCYHLLNRGNNRAAVFHHDGDYHSFVRLMRQACARVPLRVLAYCLMPNHFHLAVWPSADDQMARWMDWLLTTHVRRYRRQYGGSGHVWQGRYKAFPIEQNEHLLIVIRYIERNPLRANLVKQAAQWPWSSLRDWQVPQAMPWLHPGPVPRPKNWLDCVHQIQTEPGLAQVRGSVSRGSPFGGEAWTRATAEALGLAFTLRSPGRPRRPVHQPATKNAETELFGKQ